MSDEAPRSRAQLRNFVNAEGKISVWPRKQEARRLVLEYLSSFFEPVRAYAETEVNLIIAGKHDFGDVPLLRRAMVDCHYLERTRDGRTYTLRSGESGAEKASRRPPTLPPPASGGRDDD
ncbi:MAG: DUF2087 domain-containing protein [Candidatus Schekmanbacteria bacterium]|nr:DUF2087 domain-containing protein [Candidatus Schekmanbacteria bacterium]